LDLGSVEALAARVGIGSRHLDRLFVQHVGVPPLAVGQTRRLHFAKQLLDETDLRIIDIAMAAGFGSVRRFNDAFLNAFGKSPRELRRRANVEAGDRHSEFVELKLSYRPPYDWQHLIAFLAEEAIEGVERIAADEYSRALALSNAHVIVSVRPLLDQSGLSLRVSGAPSSALLELSTAAKRVFDLNADPDPIADVLAADPFLRSLLEKRPGLRVPGVWNPFECAVRAVLGHGAGGVGKTWLERLVHVSGRPIASGIDGVTHLFPTPLAILAAANNDLGFPKSRLTTLLALARAVHETKIDFAAQIEDVLCALRTVPGIGDDIAQYVALRAYGEPDAFPASDPVLRRLIDDLETRAQAWRPWRGYAAIHLWEAANSTSTRGSRRAARAREVIDRTPTDGHAPESV
jgi:AraC family transcriptional regulator of adaptative response / DNA-3-methyladenine glycosylase II